MKRGLSVLYILLFLFPSCAGLEVTETERPYFILGNEIKTDIFNPIDIYADNGYIFIVDGDNQIIKGFNSNKMQFGGFGMNKETFLDIKSLDGNKGKIFVLDGAGYKIKVFDSDGNYLSQFSIDNMESPSSFVLDGFGRVYILDRKLVKIFIYTEEGEYVNSFGSYGWGEGFLHNPISISYWNQEIYILDGNKVSIFDPDGNYIRKITLKEKGMDISVDRFIYILAKDRVLVLSQTGKMIGEIPGKWDVITSKKDRIYLAGRGKIDKYSISR